MRNPKHEPAKIIDNKVIKKFPLTIEIINSPIEIIDSVNKCIQNVVNDIDVKEIVSIGITNQRETTVAWSKSTGKPFYNAIVWQDTRTQSICDELLKNKRFTELIKKTGLPISTYFSLSKILWFIKMFQRLVHLWKMMYVLEQLIVGLYIT